MNSQWATYDTARFYEMARVIVHGAVPYLDFQDPKPPLIFFTLALPFFALMCARLFSNER